MTYTDEIDARVNQMFGDRGDFDATALLDASHERLSTCQFIGAVTTIQQLIERTKEHYDALAKTTEKKEVARLLDCMAKTSRGVAEIADRLQRANI